MRALAGLTQLGSQCRLSGTDTLRDSRRPARHRYQECLAGAGDLRATAVYPIAIEVGDA